MKLHHALFGVGIGIGLALPRLGAAEPRAAEPPAGEVHKVLVLKAEGRADARMRARIDAAIARLAGAAELQATTGELNFTDAATAVGCRPDAPSCKSEVLGMLAVDEIVITTVTPRSGGLEIAVQRVGRDGERDATMLLATGASPDKLDRIAPLFAERTLAAPAAEPPLFSPSPAVTSPPPSAELAASTASDQPTSRDRRLEIAGMAGGCGLTVIGLVLWTAASSVQGQINDAPTRSRDDLVKLRDLESRGDTYAVLGNALVVSGLVVGGIATYFYLRDRGAAPPAAAHLVPTVLDHGAGVALIGGLP
jgi:hypothetical protein